MIQQLADVSHWQSYQKQVDHPSDSYTLNCIIHASRVIIPLLSLLSFCYTRKEATMWGELLRPATSNRGLLLKSLRLYP